MGRRDWREVSGQAKLLLTAGPVSGLTDGQLIERFLNRQAAEAAFEALVIRHGPMVRHVCSLILRHEQDTDDAFQAVFLVLARRAGSIRSPESLAPWLHGVALRTARQTRRGRLNLVDRIELAAAAEATDRRLERIEEGEILHDEIGRLPEKQRLAVVLCCLQGMTHGEAANRLGMPPGTVGVQLMRARDRLRERLIRRGVNPGIGIPTLAALPSKIVGRAVGNSLGLIAGSHGRITAVADGVVRLLILTRLRAVIMKPVLGVVVGTALSLCAVRFVASQRAVAETPDGPGPTAAQARAGSEVSDDPKPSGARRFISGRCVSADGQPPRGAWICFRPDDGAQSFPEAWSAPIDAEGRYHIELIDAEQRSLGTGEMVSSRATGPLRFEVLAPGYRSEMGIVNVAPGTSPLTWDVRLTAQPWRETEWRLIDQAGQPVVNGELIQKIAGKKEWVHLRTDSDGACRVSSPPGRGYEITAWRPGSAPTIVGTGGTADIPGRIIVPIREPVRGRVVDPAGRPVAGLRVGRLITMDDEAASPAARPRWLLLPFTRDVAHPVTDDDGRFRIDLPLRTDTRGISKAGDLRLFSQTVCFADESCRRVGFVTLDRRKPEVSYDLTLAPPRRVRLAVKHSVTPTSGNLSTWWTMDAKTDASMAKTSIFVMSGSAMTAPSEGGDPASDWVEAFLPPGTYEIQINSAEPDANAGAEEMKTEFVVPPGEGDLNLSAVTLPPLVHNQMLDKPAPEIDAKDLDSNAPVRLADFRGRVVVLDFWGSWCGPCLGAMPELMKLHDEFAGQPVTILAVHDQSIQSRADFDVKLGSVRRTSWNDRDLPFRVALDHPQPDSKQDDPGIGRGVSAERYSVKLWPTTLLIDQAGRVAGVVNPRNHEEVAARIKTLLAKPSGQR